MIEDGDKSRPFRFLDHTADAKFQAFGLSLEEAFANAALALLSLLWERGRVTPAEVVPVRVEGRDLPQLLVGFLEEILYLFDARSFLTGRVEDVRVRGDSGQGYVLAALFSGETLRGGHRFRGEVKAVTYNEMIVAPTPDGRFMVQVVVDI